MACSEEEYHMLAEGHVNDAIQHVMERVRFCSTSQAADIVNEALAKVYLEVVSEVKNVVMYQNGWKLHRLNKEVVDKAA